MIEDKKVFNFDTDWALVIEKMTYIEKKEDREKELEAFLLRHCRS